MALARQDDQPGKEPRRNWGWAPRGEDPRQPCSLDGSQEGKALESGEGGGGGEWGIAAAGVLFYLEAARAFEFKKA